MSSWFIFNSLGFYPNAGQDIYLIGTPSFPEADIHLASGKTLRILAKDLDPQHLNHYVQSAADQRHTTQPILVSPQPNRQRRHAHPHHGAGPSQWGTTNPPPSLSDATSPLCADAAQRQPFHSNAPPSTLTLLSCRPAPSNSTKFRSSARIIAITQASLPAKASCGSRKSLIVSRASTTAILRSPGNLTAACSQLELDVFADTQGGRYAHPSGPQMVAAASLPADPPFDPDGMMMKPGFKVMHVQDLDYRSNCQPFTACLAEIRAWSRAHPAAHPHLHPDRDQAGSLQARQAYRARTLHLRHL